MEKNRHNYINYTIKRKENIIFRIINKNDYSTIHLAIICTEMDIDDNGYIRDNVADRTLQ